MELGSPLPQLHRDWAHPCHICAGTGLAPMTSAPGLGSPLRHLRRDWSRIGIRCAVSQHVARPCVAVHGAVVRRGSWLQQGSMVATSPALGPRWCRSGHSCSTTRGLCSSTSSCAAGFFRARSRRRCGWGEPKSRRRCGRGEPKSRRRCGRGEPKSRRSCGRVEPSPGADARRRLPRTRRPRRSVVGRGRTARCNRPPSPDASGRVPVMQLFRRRADAPRASSRTRLTAGFPMDCAQVVRLAARGAAGRLGLLVAADPRRRRAAVPRHARGRCAGVPAAAVAAGVSPVPAQMWEA